MAVKDTLAVTGVTPDSAKNHLVAYGTIQNIVREGVGDVGLELYCGAGRKGVPSLPVHGNRKCEPTAGMITAIS